MAKKATPKKITRRASGIETPLPPDTTQACTQFITDHERRDRAAIRASAAIANTEGR